MQNQVLAILTLLVFFFSFSTTITCARSVQYSLETILGRTNSSWPQFSTIIKLSSSQEQPERWIYVHMVTGKDTKGKLYKFDRLDGSIVGLLNEVAIISHVVVGQKLNENIRDVIYYLSEEPSCYLMKYSPTESREPITIAGSGKCCGSIQSTTTYSNMPFCRGTLTAFPNVFRNDNELVIYFSDATSIRKLNNGLVEVFVGGGNSKSLDDQPATNVSITPSSVCVNSQNELLISDYAEGANNYRIRKVFSNGIITTISKEDVFVSIICSYNSTVYYMDGVMMVKDTVYVYRYLESSINESSFTFKYPNNEYPKLVNSTYTKILGIPYKRVNGGDGGLSKDASMLYISDLSIIANRYLALSYLDIRFLDLETRTISKFMSENGHRSFSTTNNFMISSPKDLIYSYNNGNPELFIGESNSASILKYSLSSKTLETVKRNMIQLSNEESTASPSTSNPYSLALDSYGNLIVSNDNSYWTPNMLVNLTKRGDPSVMFGKRVATNTISNVATSVLNRPSGVMAIPFKGDILIFVSDTNNNRVLQISFNNGTIKTIANQDDGINSPSGLAFFYVGYDAFPQIYVIFSDTNNHCLRNFDLQTNQLTVYAGTPGVKGFRDGNRLNATFNSPVGLFVRDHVVYVADSQNHAIRKILGSEVTTIAGTGEPGFNGDGRLGMDTQLNNPQGVFLNGHGVVIADTNNHRIRNLDARLIISTLAGTTDGSGGDEGLATRGELYHPHSVCEYDSALFISDTSNNKIRSVGYHDNVIRTVISQTGYAGFEGDDSLGLLAKINSPTSCYAYKESNKEIFFFADTRNDRIRYYTASDKLIRTLVGGFGDSGPSVNGFGSPLGVTVNLNNEIYVTDIRNNLIRHIRDGYIYTVAGNGGYGFNGDYSDARKASLASPSCLAVTPSEDLIISDTNNHRIRILYKNGTISTIAGTGVYGFNGDGPGLSTQLYSPTFIKLIPPKFEDVIFSDSKNGRIRKLSKSNDVYTVSTIAGGGKDLIGEQDALEVSLGFPEGLSYSTDGKGEIYFSDSSRNLVRKLKPYCQTGYVLSLSITECIPTCFGVATNESTSCSGNGICRDYNVCECSTGLYIGNQCQYPLCFGVSSNNISVCSYSGTCKEPNICTCREGLKGMQCEEPICFGKSGKEACSKRGECVGVDSCNCNEGYSGMNCEQDNIMIGVTVGLSILFAIIVSGIIVTLAILFRKYRNQKKILDTDLSLDERLLTQNDKELSNTSSNRTYVDEEDKFVIPIEQLNMDKPIRRLGEGGMGCVFQTKYNGMLIAVKVFDLNNLNISEDDFKIEAILLSKLRHPNIINFYGISSTPTKRFIAMECMDKSLESLIASLQRGHTRCSLQQKLQILLNVVSGIKYLHHLEPHFIVHRDLKPANILLDKNGTAKLCDFGLGRAFSSQTISAMTNQIGTSNYMSPELFSGNIGRDDARSVDIYSLSIIVWQVLLEIMEPYQSSDTNVLQKLRLSKPNSFSSTYHFHKSVCEDGLRPVIPFSTPIECKEWCEEFLAETDQATHYNVVYEMTLLVRQCWQHEPTKRPDTIHILQKIEEWQGILNV